MLYIRKQFCCGTGQQICSFSTLGRINNFAFESLFLIYKEHLICFLLLDFRLISPVFSSWLLNVRPWFFFFLSCNYLWEFLCSFESLQWENVEIVNSSFRLLLLSDSSFPLTFFGWSVWGSYSEVSRFTSCGPLKNQWGEKDRTSIGCLQDKCLACCSISSASH